MRATNRDQVLGIVFLVLGFLALMLAITNQTVIIGTGLCFALGALFLARAARRG